MSNRDLPKGVLRGAIIFLAFLVIGALVGIIFLLQYYSNTHPANNNNSAIEGNQTNEVEEELGDYEYPDFKSSKVLKSSDDVDSDIKYEIKTADAQGMFSAFIINDKVYIQKKDITGLFDETYINSTIEENKFYEIGNIDKKVIDIHIGYVGEGIINPVLLILTEDGSLRYLKLADAVSTGNYNASDVITKKIVRMEDVSVTKDNKNSNSIIVITKDRKYI